MTEKTVWLEEVLSLEPNSKLFFPLARAYVQDSRHDDAVAVLRKGLSFHPEHLEARLLLIECLAYAQEAPYLDQARLIAPELEPLTVKLAAYPAFWKQWAARCRNHGQPELALTLDILAGLLSGTSLTWGAVLEQGLHALITQSAQTQAFAYAPPASTEASSPEQRSSHFSETAQESEVRDESREDERPAGDMAAHFDAELKREPELETEPDAELMPPLDQNSDGDTSKPESPKDSSSYSGAKPALVSGDLPDASGRSEEISSKPEVPFSAPSEPGEVEIQLTEGERHYYETKTYADLLAKQGEHEEALGLYSKLLQTSPDDDKRRDLQTRIRELRERIAKYPKEFEPEDIPPQADTGEAMLEDIEAMPIGKSSDFSSISKSTTETLVKLAERLESRAAK